MFYSIAPFLTSDDIVRVSRGQKMFSINTKDFNESAHLDVG